MGMGDIIKKLRTEKGITQEELGRVIGVQKSAIRKYESGLVENIKRDSIKKLADYFGVTPTYILGYEDARELSTHFEKISPLSPYVKLPKLGATAAGEPLYAESAPGDWEYADVMYGDGNHYFLDVDGDSMSPTIPDGSRVIIKVQDFAEHDGQIVVACVDGQNITLKRYYALPSGDILLKADNPSAKNYVITKADIESGEARILGIAREYKIRL